MIGIQVSRSLNQCCVPDSYLESMLLTAVSKNVFRHHRSRTDASLAKVEVGYVPRSDIVRGISDRFFGFNFPGKTLPDREKSPMPPCTEWPCARRGMGAKSGTDHLILIRDDSVSELLRFAVRGCLSLYSCGQKSSCC